MGKQTVNILYQSSDAYAPYTGVSITSLFENNKHLEDIHVYLLDDGISEGNKEKFVELERQYDRIITFLDTKRVINTIKESEGKSYNGSYVTYCKDFVISKLGEISDRILYIDSDTIVDRQIDMLYYTKMGQSICAMVQDVSPIPLIKTSGIKQSDIYYNCGVVLFDIQGWRSQNCEDAILSHMKNVRSDYPIADQDILNILFSKKIKKLDLECNFFVPFLSYGIDKAYSAWSLKKLKDFYSINQIEEASKTAIIYHFLSDVHGRPWERGNSCALAYKWEKYLRISPWKDFEKINMNLPITIRIQKMIFDKVPWSGFYKIFHKVYRIKMTNKYRVSEKSL